MKASDFHEITGVIKQKTLEEFNLTVTLKAIPKGLSVGQELNCSHGSAGLVSGQVGVRGRIRLTLSCTPNPREANAAAASCAGSDGPPRLSTFLLTSASTAAMPDSSGQLQANREEPSQKQRPLDPFLSLCTWLTGSDRLIHPRCEWESHMGGSSFSSWQAIFRRPRNSNMCMPPFCAIL